MSDDTKDCPRCHGVDLLCDDLCPLEDEDPPLAVAPLLGLTDSALEVAIRLVARFPGVEIVSGKRTVREQAHSMAANVVKDPDFVRDTYALSLASRRCQAWVDRNVNAKLDKIAEAFERILCDLPDDELRHLTRHITGEAFDVMPPKDLKLRNDVKVFLADAAREHGGRFLDHEGKLDRLHWQAGDA